MGPIIDAPVILGEAFWIALQILFLFFLVFVLVRVLELGGAGGRLGTPRLPEDVLFRRYKRGELSRQQYSDALLDMYRDRSVWDGSDGYEAPLALLRMRYAQGDVTREQYLDALIDFLKERYVRGELEVDEYESQLDLLLRETSKRRSGPGAA